MLYKKYAQLLMHAIRHFFYLIWVNVYSRSVKPNTLVSIDVIIPVIEKDLLILPLCLEGLKENVKHRIENIYIVGADSKLIKEFASDHGLLFIDESTVLGYSPGDINYISSGLNRSGWIFQQLLKLSGRIGTSRYFLVIDSDHILLKPHVFIAANNSMVFYQSSEWHFPYYKKIYKLTGTFPTALFSYVAHKMILDKEELKKLHQLIESSDKNQLPWDRILCSQLDINEPSCFSEFELYGNYIAKEKKILLPWRHKALNKKLLTNYKELQALYSGYLSVTFPYYLEDK